MTRRNLVPEAKYAVNHYWLLAINIRDMRFELLDSMRSKADKKLDLCAKKLITVLISLWEDQYPQSHIQFDRFGYVDIEPPKQITPHDCGVCALYNAEHWNGRFLPAYEGANIPSIRKLITHTWVTSTFNDVNWKGVPQMK